ncbi:unnamed protein product [Owenia fusiformis]|uniref:Uncharacterized protein n=1 Tax=Owenia fusiformis TaxID=6347 RepID=A0A8J1TME4_OWEFU|nr:unnamed protein product [Owenia fusiformis]
MNPPLIARIFESNMDTDKEKVDDWRVECSDDDERYKPAPIAGQWEPDPKDILKLYEKLSKGEELTMEWTIPPRRSPSPLEKDLDMEVADTDSESPTQHDKPAAPTEFDFDDDFGDGGLEKITPRKTPGTKTPRSTKRVARFDQIFSSVVMEKKNQLKAKDNSTPQRPTEKTKARTLATE